MSAWLALNSPPFPSTPGTEPSGHVLENVQLTVKPKVGSFLRLVGFWDPFRGDTRMCLSVAVTAVWYEPVNPPSAFTAEMVMLEPSSFFHSPDRTH